MIFIFLAWRESFLAFPTVITPILQVIRIKMRVENGHSNYLFGTEEMTLGGSVCLADPL